MNGPRNLVHLRGPNALRLSSSCYSCLKHALKGDSFFFFFFFVSAQEFLFPLFPCAKVFDLRWLLNQPYLPTALIFVQEVPRLPQCLSERQTFDQISDVRLQLPYVTRASVNQMAYIAQINSTMSTAKILLQTLKNSRQLVDYFVLI